MFILIFCGICIIICISIFGLGIGLLISIPGCIIGIVAFSFISGPETRHEEMMDEIRGIRDDLDDHYDDY